ncbi:MAG: hypothetical protein SGARI_003993, partial [Bacillariaceae sp.]
MEGTKKETFVAAPAAPDLLDQPMEQPQQQQQQQHSASSMTIRELRAICHGAGVNTAGMERGQLERAAQDVMNRGTYFSQNGSAAQPQQYTQQPPQQYQQHAHAPAPSSAQSHHSWGSHNSGAPTPAPRLGIKELRAICHGAG